MSTTTLTYDGFDPAHEPLREALCTLGNGSFATRGAQPESAAGGPHYPGTYAAGVFNRLRSHVAGRVVENEDLVNLPNWLPLTFRVDDGDWFDLARVELLEYRQELDLRKGVLVRLLRFRDQAGRRTRLAQRRFVHMADAHLAGLETTIVAEDWSGRLQVRSALDGRVENAGVARYRQLAGRHLRPEAAEDDGDTLLLVMETNQSRVRIAEAARTRMLRNGEELPADRRALRQADWVAHELSLDLAEGDAATVEKVVAVYLSRDRAISEPAVESRTAIARADGFDELLARHTLAWDHLWGRFHLEIDGHERTQLVLNLHIYHLLQTVSDHTVDLDAGVPARGLHGEAYRGHIFWDELFIFPFLNLHAPELTRALLRYRYRRLPEARQLARDAGHAGACYPWQSGSNGREESQTLHLNPRSGRWVPDNSHLQRHINIAVAYNVWQYYQATGDGEFLSAYGAEMLLEIARFWSSMASYNRSLDRYEIHRVMGPDEYHDAYPGRDEPGLSNNAYTNVMAVWVLCRALDTLELLPEPRRRELWDSLGLTRGELERWEDIGAKMRVVFHDHGVISQFEGYGQLEEFDWDGYRARYGDIHRLDRILEAEGDTVNRYKASKQADVLMLFYLLSSAELEGLFERLGYDFDADLIPRNIDYYLGRTSHGSTLSNVVHSWVLARSDRRRSWQFFTQALESDVSDIQGGTTPEGIHLGAMAGTVDLVQRCYPGLETREEVLWLHPSLPDELEHLEFTLRYRGDWGVRVAITRERVRISTPASAAGPIRVACNGDLLVVQPGDSADVACRG